MAKLELRIERILNKYEKKALLGLVSISAEEFNSLVNEFSEMLHNPEKFRNNKRGYLTTMTLIGFNMYQFTGGKFWEELDFYLNFNNPTMLRLKCVTYFESYCNKNLLSLYSTEKKTMYRESIQMHTIIAQHQFEKFIPVLVGLYMKDLEEDTSDEVILELLRYLKKLFKLYEGQEEIISEYRGSKMSLTIQQLPQSFKQAFLLNFSSVAGLMKRYFKYFEILRSNSSVNFRTTNYYDKLFRNHLLEIENQFNKEANSNKYKSEIGIKKFHRPFYRLQQVSDGLQLSLILPKQLILPNAISDTIKVSFWENEIKIKEEELEANPGTLFWKTFQKEVVVNHLYPNLNYKITSKDEIIYDSQKQLMFSFLLFNEIGDQINALHLKNNETYFLITEQDAEVETINTTSEFIYRENNYLRYELIFNEETEIMIDGILLSTSIKEQPDGFSTPTKYSGARILSKEIEYDLIKTASFFSLTSSKGYTLSDYHIMVNGIMIDEKEIADVSQSYLLGDGTGRLKHTINFNSFIGDNLTLVIKIKRKDSIFAYFERNYIVINDLEWQFEKDYYTREKSAKIDKLFSESLKLKLDPFHNPKVAVKVGFYRQPFNIQGKEFWIEIAIPLICLQQLDYSESYEHDIKLKERYFYRDIPFEELTLSIPGQTFEIICSMSSSVKKMHIKRKGKDSIVNFKTFLSRRRSDVHRFSMKLNGNYYPLFDVHFEESVHNINVRYTDPNKLMGGLLISGEYIGESVLCLDIFNIEGELLKSFKKIIFPFRDSSLDLPYGIYKVELYKEVPSFFSNKNERKVYYTTELIYGDKFVLKNRSKRAQTIEALCEDGNIKSDRLFFDNFAYDSILEVYKAKAFFCYQDWHSGREKKVYLDENPIHFQEVIPSGKNVIIDPVDSHGELLVIDTHTKKINPREANNSNDYERYKVIENLIIRIL